MFDTTAETLYGPGISFDLSVKAQLYGVATIVSWSGILSFIMFSAIKNMGLLRVDEHHEAMGIDLAEFSPRKAYSGSVFAFDDQKLIMKNDDDLLMQKPSVNGFKINSVVPVENGTTSEPQGVNVTPTQPTATVVEPL